MLRLLLVSVCVYIGVCLICLGFLLSAWLPQLRGYRSEEAGSKMKELTLPFPEQSIVDDRNTAYPD